MSGIIETVSINVIAPPDNKWGTRLTFSRWTGMVEMVRLGEVSYP